MEIKNLFDPVVKKDIMDRINKLSATSTAQWGKMNVGQMLAHCQAPIGVAQGIHKLARPNFLIRLIGSLVKPILYNNKPFKQGLPTAPSFIVTDTRDFEMEKNKLLGMVSNFKEDTFVTAKHPFFGTLTKEQWSKGTWKHLDHHLRQFGV